MSAISLNTTCSVRSCRSSIAAPQQVKPSVSLSSRHASFSKSQLLYNTSSVSFKDKNLRSQKGLQVLASTMYDFSAKIITGQEVQLSKFKGKNYKELVTVYNQYKSRGFEVLAFPCNQFGGQEPGTDAEIKSFAQKYGAKFPLFSKIEVNGNGTHPLYKFLKDSQKEFLGNDIKWNFAKFLVDKEGKAVKRYAPTSSPSSITKDIEKYL